MTAAFAITPHLRKQLSTMSIKNVTFFYNARSSQQHKSLEVEAPPSILACSAAAAEGGAIKRECTTPAGREYVGCIE
jgi:hypothetical protein